MYKRILSLLLCLCVLFSLVLPVGAEEIKENRFIISNLKAFLVFAEKCRLDSFSENLRVILKTDIDLSGTGFESIPTFSGTFEGNGHTIRGLRITGDGSTRGLFRYLTDTASVQDLNVAGTVQAGGSEVGGIAGSNAGKILNCNFTGYVSGNEYVGGIAGEVSVSGIIENCTMSGRIYGNHFVGGMAGSSSGVIRGCENGARINDTALENTVELSDITLNSLTSSEAVNTVTDLGGIAGHSIGVIRECVNRGAIGYQHMGYNIGGIAGTQSGALLDCENYGQIQGRKEVGGIVGQLEPTALIEYEEDALQILKRQLSSMGGVVNDTVSNVQNTTDAIVYQVGTLQNHVWNAQDAVDSLIPDREDPHLPDLDTIQAAKNTISSSISGMSQTLQGMSATTYSAMGALSTNLYSLQSQINAMRTTLGNVSETLGGSITDVSDKDTDLDLTGKVANCKNYGDILADRNAGGIAGAIAMENDLDYEEDWFISGENSLNFESELRAVIVNSVNAAQVTCRKQNAGGIAGWQSMGLVRGCTNSGKLNAQGADHVGGISGQSLGFIRSSYAKCEIIGDAYTGGIAGSATIVTDCRSMVKLDGDAEKTGEILGFAEETRKDEETPISGNLYLSVSEDMGAIDGISYAGAAQPVSREEFLRLEDIPEFFRSVTVQFLYKNGHRRSFTVPLGEAFETRWIPPVPPKNGYVAVWEGLCEDDLAEVMFDRTYELRYSSKDSTLQSTQLRDNMPVLLVQGVFGEAAALSMAELDTAVPVEAGETVLEAWNFSVSDAESLTSARLRIPTEESGNIKVLLCSGGQWRQAEHSEDGSYLVFALEAGDTGIALVREASKLGLILMVAAAAVIVFAAGILQKNKDRKYPNNKKTFRKK